MKLVSLLLSAFFTATGLCGQEPPRISVDRASIEAGQSCTLTWKTDSDSTFLSGVGKVKASDTLVVSPQTSTEYVLITEKAGEVYSTSVKVKVLGSKGETPFPDLDEFPQGLAGEHKSISYPDFLDFVFKTLQNKLDFRVRGDFLPGRRFDILFTDRRPKPEMLTPDDTGIRQRRISYAVRIDEPDSKARPIVIRFEVKIIIDYQRLGESKWRPETNQQIIYNAANALKQQLEATAGAKIR